LSTLTRAWLTLRNPDCDDCVLGETAQCVCLIGRGPVPCEVMVIGEAPGKREDEIEKPFSGSAGKILDQAFSSMGVTRDEVYITNVVKCRPPENRDPTNKEIKACSRYLQAEIELVKPKYVLLLGRFALMSFLGRGHSSITKERGKIQKLNGMTVIATLHPASLLYNPKNLILVEMDITKFFRLVQGTPDPVVSYKKTMTRVWDEDALEECVKALKGSNLISLDLETSGLDPRTPDSAIYCIALSDKEGHAWVIPLEHHKSPWEHKANIVYDALRPILEDPKVRWVTQNGQFDLVWLRLLAGIWVPKIYFDTMVVGYLLDENMPHNLEFLVQLFLGVSNYKDDSKNFNKDFPLGRLMRHNAKDAIYTRSLYGPMNKKLREDVRLTALAKHISMPGIMLATDMETNGVQIGPKRLVKARIKVRKAMEAVTEKMNGLLPESFRELQGIEVVNWGSPKQVANILYSEEGLGLPVEIKTPKGAPSTSEKALIRLRDEHQLIELLMEFRGFKHSLSFFLDGWKDKIKPNNRMYPKYRIARVVTGRFSSNDPNLQQVPRDPKIRGIITAEPGWVLVEADFSQIELRIAAEMARDKNMIRAFLSGEDIHMATARSILGLPAEKVTKEQRKKAKSVNFGFLYGMSAKGFQEYALTKFETFFTEEEAEEYRARFFGVYRDLLAWHKRQKEVAAKLGYVRSILGRIRHLPDIYSPDRGVRAEAQRQAINAPVQGTATDFVVLGASKLKEQHDRDFPDRYHPTMRILSIIHDALLMAIRKDHVDYWVPRIKQVLENLPLHELFGVGFFIPIVTEIKVGKHWGSLQPWEKSRTQ